MNDSSYKKSLAKNASYEAGGKQRGRRMRKYADEELGPRNEVDSRISPSYKNLPETPGVYLMKNGTGEIIYIGKAGNLKRRVSSYFLRPHDSRIEKLVTHIAKIDIQQTDSALESLILESELIKKHQPIFNVREKDDKSFLYVEITKEKFPRVRLVRGKDNPQGTRFGPFTSSSNLREALKIVRRIFPWNTHSANEIGKLKRECLECQIGLCPGTCVGKIDRKTYFKNIANIKLFFGGKKKKIIAGLEKEMAKASKALEFEEAERMHRQIFALQHIRDVAFISDSPIGNWKLKIGNSAKRIEGYDISNISGTSAVGSMVVFENDKPNKTEYRKFRIRGGNTPNDIGMITEILERRFENKWPLPNCILIDGGLGQVSAARKVLRKYKHDIPIVGLAKGPKRKNNFVVGHIPAGIKKETLIRVRDEAHRFAIIYHKKVRSREALR